MSTDSVPAGDDPRRLLSDARTLAHRVRVDQRVTWVALLVLAAVTLVAIPVSWFGLQLHCHPDGSCQVKQRAGLYYWPPALLAAYAVIAVCYVRAARARGLGARVLPYVITGAATTVVFTAAFVAGDLYLRSHPLPDHPHPDPYWWFLLNQLISPQGMIGVALLVLARLERNVALLLFTLAYLTLVLLVLPTMNFGPPHFGIRAGMVISQLIIGAVLLMGAVGFAAARRRHR
jgi:hypothetical protein